MINLYRIFGIKSMLGSNLWFASSTSLHDHVCGAYSVEVTIKSEQGLKKVRERVNVMHHMSLLGVRAHKVVRYLSGDYSTQRIFCTLANEQQEEFTSKRLTIKTRHCLIYVRKFGFILHM